MRDVALVDAAYLRGAAARLRNVPLASVSLNPEAVIGLLGGDSLGGVLWYDARAAGEPLRPDTRDAVVLPGVKSRMGRRVTVEPRWQNSLRTALRSEGVDLSEFSQHFELRPIQVHKGVDVLMVLDLLRLQRAGVAHVSVLSGDGSLVEALSLLESEGVEVTLYVESSRSSSYDLRSLKGVHSLSDEELLLLSSDASSPLQAPSASAALSWLGMGSQG